MKITWQEVLRDWEADEVERYRGLYESRGFDSWLEWRRSCFEDLQLAERTWSEALIENPYDVVPQLHIGGFQGWFKYRPERKLHATFADVVRVPIAGEVSYEGEARVDVRTNDGVMRFKSNPGPVTLLVLIAGDFRVVLEGTHRSAAIAAIAADGLEQLLNPVTARICRFDDSERVLLEDFARDRKATKKKGDY